MTRKTFALSLFWLGLLFAFVFAGVAGWDLAHNLRTLTSEELAQTIWNRDEPLFGIWAMSVSLGSLLAGIGALIYVKARATFVWLTALAVPIVVFVMTFIWSAEYYPALFGAGGVLILSFFFALVWLWMKRYAKLELREKIAGGYKLVGYLFWLNASWFLCGEFGSLHQRAFEGRSMPSPIEIMVYLVLGWFFVLVGETRSKQVSESNVPDIQPRDASSRPVTRGRATPT